MLCGGGDPGGCWEHRGSRKKAGRRAMRGRRGLGQAPSRDHRAWEGTHPHRQAEAPMPHAAPGSPRAPAGPGPPLHSPGWPALGWVQ